MYTKLEFKRKDDWVEWAKSNERPIDIPTNPSSAYKNTGWLNWGDWLGTRNRKGGYRSFEEARAFLSKPWIEGKR